MIRLPPRPRNTGRSGDDVAVLFKAEVSVTVLMSSNNDNNDVTTMMSHTSNILTAELSMNIYIREAFYQIHNFAANANTSNASFQGTHTPTLWSCFRASVVALGGRN